MGESLRYYLAKVESYLKNNPDGLSDFDLVMRLDVSASLWDKLKALLKNHPQLDYNSESGYWKFIQPIDIPNPGEK